MNRAQIKRVIFHYRIQPMRTFLFALVSLVSVSIGATAAPAFADLQPGPLAVGWKVIQQYDYARTYQGLIDPVSGEPTHGERARPIQTQVWYPARKGGAP